MLSLCVNAQVLLQTIVSQHVSRLHGAVASISNREGVLVPKGGVTPPSTDCSDHCHVWWSIAVARPQFESE